jgi:apolipoprotein N-acyltransferase
MSDTEPDGRPVEGTSDALSASAWGASWLWFPLAGGLFLFANGRNNVAIAAWLAPVFMLRFLRGGSASRALALYAVIIAGWAFQFRGMVPLPQPGLAIVWMAYGLAVILPFLVDRAAIRRSAAFWSTLLFPCAAAGVDYVVSLLPYGSWGSPAYTQYGNLPLIQLASLTGIYGITFLMAWTASVVNWAWERGFEGRKVRRGALVYVCVLSAVLFWGGVRIMFPPSGPTVRIVSLTQPDIEPFPNDDAGHRAVTGKLTPGELADIRNRSKSICDNLLSRAAREADAGARIVFWGEGNSFVLSEDEATFMARAAQFAQDKKIYLGLGNVVWHYGSEKPLENTLVLFDPDGKLLWRFLKAHPVPGGEAAISKRADGRLKFTDTPFGRMSGVICFDADSVQLLHQAGKGAADLLLIPSNDWRAIDPWHTQMAVFRGVEQGFNMVRHVSHGLSIATDFQGRVHGAMDHYDTAGDRVLVAQLPTRGVRTVYGRLGDLFAWLAVVGATVLLIRAARTN